MVDHCKTYYTAPCGHEVQQLDSDNIVDTSESISELQRHIDACPACQAVNHTPANAN